VILRFVQFVLELELYSKFILLHKQSVTTDLGTVYLSTIACHLISVVYILKPYLFSFIFFSFLG